MDEREVMGLIESFLFVSGDALPIEKIASFIKIDVKHQKTDGQAY